eukprot:COSAG01_NODE_937_length_12628_cov_12.665257_9_plen_390_part_00
MVICSAPQRRQERAIPPAPALQPGDLVVRGRDWPAGSSKDGGAGSVGRVIATAVKGGWVIVRWPGSPFDKSSRTQQVRYGSKGKYEVQLIRQTGLELEPESEPQIGEVAVAAGHAHRVECIFEQPASLGLHLEDVPGGDGGRIVAVSGVQPGTQAAVKPLRAGMRLLEVDGMPAATVHGAVAMIQAAGRPLRLTFSSDSGLAKPQRGERVEASGASIMTGTMDTSDDVASCTFTATQAPGSIGVEFCCRDDEHSGGAAIVVGSVEPGSAAARQGVAPGMRLLTVTAVTEHDIAGRRDLRGEALLGFVEALMGGASRMFWKLLVLAGVCVLVASSMDSLTFAVCADSAAAHTEISAAAASGDGRHCIYRQRGTAAVRRSNQGGPASVGDR